jgi:hypothetical protein
MIPRFFRLLFLFPLPAAAACMPAPRSPPIVAAAQTAALAAPATVAPPAPYRAIHIDTLVPEKRAQFEAARKEWVTELRRVGASDWRGLFLEVGQDRFYSVRPLEAFASLDPKPSEPGAAQKPDEPEPSEAAGKRYDDLSDDALAYPHTSEIWRPAKSLGYAPPSGVVTEQTAECGTLLIEDLRADTTSMTRYRNAVHEVLAALGEAHYPLTRIAYATAYGAGHLYTFLLAPSRAALAAAPKIEEVLTQARGAAKAKEILADIDAVVIRRETLPVTIRRDLTVP